MMRLPMARAASALLRALLERVAEGSDRILLSEVSSVDWRSLTLEGERHAFCLRIIGEESEGLLSRLCDGLEEAEFSIPGLIVADIIVGAVGRAENDGALAVTIEALTIAE